MKGTLIRYKVRPEKADENQQLIEKVFTELNAKSPEGVRYMALRLPDGTFQHFVLGEPERRAAITDSGSFRSFQQGIKERVVDPPQQSDVTVVGDNRMLRD